MTPNEARGEFLVNLNGAEYVVIFDAFALMALERELKIRIGREPVADNDPFQVGLVNGTVVLTWAGLLHGNPTLSVGDVAAMLTPLFRRPESLGMLRRGLAKAYAFAWGVEPTEAKDESKNAQAANVGAGNDSPS